MKALKKSFSFVLFSLRNSANSMTSAVWKQGNDMVRME